VAVSRVVSRALARATATRARWGERRPHPASVASDRLPARGPRPLPSNAGALCEALVRHGDVDLQRAYRLLETVATTARGMRQRSRAARAAAHPAFQLCAAIAGLARSMISAIGVDCRRKASTSSGLTLHGANHCLCAESERARVVPTLVARRGLRPRRPYISSNAAAAASVATCVAAPDHALTFDGGVFRTRVSAWRRKVVECPQVIKGQPTLEPKLQPPDAPCSRLPSPRRCSR
jgi:hypothetical protein